MGNLSLNTDDFKGSPVEKGILDNNLEKGREMPIGTISRGYKKVAKGKWVPVKKTGQKPSVWDGKLTRNELVDLHNLGQSTDDGAWSKYEVLMNKLFGGNPERDVKLALSQTENADNFATFVLNKYNVKDDQGPDPSAPKISKDAVRLNPNGTWDNEVVEKYLSAVGGLKGIKGKTASELLNHTLNYNLVRHSMNVILEQTDPKEGVQGIEKRLLEANGNKFESAIVFDKDGKQIMGHTTGEKSKVEFDANQTEKMKGAFALTHNHPSSSGLSAPDLFTGIKLGLKDVRAVAPKSIYGPGTWVMVNNYPNAGKSSGAGFQSARLATQMNLHDDKVRNYFEDQIYSTNGADRNKEIKIADSLHVMEVAMHTDTFKQGKIEFFFEDQNGNRKKLDHLSGGKKSASEALYDL